METLGDKIRSLRADGKKYREIVEELKCSKAVISYHLNDKVKLSSLAASRKARKEKEVWLNKLKDETPCADCGQNFEHFLMDFDHLPEYDKLGDVSDFLWSVGWTRLKEEIAKCEIVCCMCHRKRSRARHLAKSSTLDYYEN